VTQLANKPLTYGLLGDTPDANCTSQELTLSACMHVGVSFYPQLPIFWHLFFSLRLSVSEEMLFTIINLIITSSLLMFFFTRVMKPIYYILDLLNTFQIYFSSHFYFVI
jgi:hypothetical protein